MHSLLRDDKGRLLYNDEGFYLNLFQDRWGNRVLYAVHPRTMTFVKRIPYLEVAITVSVKTRGGHEPIILEAHSFGTLSPNEIARTGLDNFASNLKDFLVERVKREFDDMKYRVEAKIDYLISNVRKGRTKPSEVYSLIEKSMWYAKAEDQLMKAGYELIGQRSSRSTIDYYFEFKDLDTHKTKRRYPSGVGSYGSLYSSFDEAVKSRRMQRKQLRDLLKRKK